MPDPSQKSARRFGILIAVLFVAVPLVTWIATFLTDYLWFVDVGQRDVFVITLGTEVAVGVAFGVVAFLLLFTNLRLARTMAPRAVLTSVGEMPPQVEEAVFKFRARVSPLIDKLILWGSLAIAFIVGLAMAEYWDVIRLAMAAVPFGIDDPQFGRDVGFYIFTLPALRLVADWLLAMLVATTIVTMLANVADGAIQPWARLKGFAPHVKAHLSVLLGLIVATKAFDYYLDIYELTLSPRGQVTGASYTDVNAQLPALQILIVIALASAITLLVNIRIQGWRLPTIALGVWVAASVLVGSVYPALVQQFQVDPNEITTEAPYIERNIESTRRAFGLEGIETRPFPAGTDLTAQDVLDNRDTLENVRLWDPSIVTQSYRQLQVIRPYYDFRDVDVDRYEIDGRSRQVLVSAREMDVQQLATNARTWQNQHLIYTHGYGMVMSPVNEADSKGLPNFVIKDIPPRTATDIEFDRPAIYFGEATTDYVIVNTDEEEFDYPLSEDGAETSNASTNYEGKAGISTGSFLRRAAFALRFGAAQILFSDAINSESRVLFDRDIFTRVEKLAPWLWLDDDPYPIITDGRVVWVLDGYTWSDGYPYSEPLYGLSYIRNSVKITVDAYDGTTTLYGFDPDDPILKTWSAIFPGLIASAEEIPEDVQAHFRYPEDLFSIQAEVYKDYHMTNARTFYNKEDSWELPGERSEAGPMQPFYVLMRLPGETAEDFQMIVPFTARNRDNMIGWMAANADPEEYGKRVVYQFPKAEVIFGPEQISARINQDETISQQLTLWSQRGSQVLFGNMLVIPLEDSIVYIQPLYLQAEQTAIPELTRVIVVYSDRVEMAPNLEDALLQVFGERPAQETTSTAGVVGDASVEAAQDLYERAIEAQRDGDWSEYGRLIEELGRILDSLAFDGAPSTEATVTE